jgi:hypothetical protein
MEDIRLVFSNCYAFNAEGTDVVVMCKVVEKIFNDSLANLPEPEVEIIRPPAKRRSSGLIVTEPPKPVSPAAANRPRRQSTRVVRAPSRDYLELSPSQSRELRKCKAVLNEFTHKRHLDYSYPFLQPVDAVALGLHDYHNVIKQPMDLATIKSKLDSNLYRHKEEFADDVRLMFKNCFTYNPPKDPIIGLAKRLLGVFEFQWAKVISAVSEPPKKPKRGPRKSDAASPSVSKKKKKYESESENEVEEYYSESPEEKSESESESESEEESDSDNDVDLEQLQRMQQ